MANEINVAALAKLARLEVSTAEMAKLKKEIPAILHFVDTIQSANVGREVNAPALHNVMRADENPIEPGTFTEKILSVAPAREGDRIAVKQVISRSK